MMKPYIYVLFMLAVLMSCNSVEDQNTSTEELNNKPETTVWRGELQLNDSINLPFIFSSTTGGDRLRTLLKNGEENILMKTLVATNDSMALEFPVYQARLFANVNGNSMAGYFQKTDTENYLVPFTAVKNDSLRFKATKQSCCVLPGRWKAVFKRGEKETLTIGEFKQTGERLTGSFITEFGDYRFLEGTLSGNQFSLYGFDGGYLQVFTAQVKEGNLVNGHYYSGLTGYQTWSATPDETFELTNPEIIAELNTEALPVSFSYPGIDGNTVSYSPEAGKNKVTIIQITGSWCPNCKDQARYLQELKDTYVARGLQVLGVAFERMGTLEKSIAAAKKSKQDLGTDYPVGIAKYNRDQVAEEVFSFLKKIRSYPTIIILDKQGNVRKVHTGFSGPGTSQYKPQTAVINAFIEELLNE